MRNNKPISPQLAKKTKKKKKRGGSRTYGGVLTIALVTTFTIYRKSSEGGTSGRVFVFSVFNTPTAAQ
jgi:hypothetical protein